MRQEVARYVHRFTVAAIAGLLSMQASAAITGNVFQDYNGDGIKNTTGTAGATSTDIGIAGVSVKAYGQNNTLCGSATTVAVGTYSLALSSVAGDCAGPQYRVEFSGLPVGFFPTAHNTDSIGAGVVNSAGTATQFVADGATNVNFSANEPCDYCQNNPTV